MTAWPERVKALVWEKAEVVPEVDAASFRKDACGAWMAWDHYGNPFSTFGWEIDYVTPADDDSLSNLHALQWDNFVARTEGGPHCPVTSRGDQNVRRW